MSGDGIDDLRWEASDPDSGWFAPPIGTASEQIPLTELVSDLARWFNIFSGAGEVVVLSIADIYGIEHEGIQSRLDKVGA